jgi:hypothetical protein
MIGGTGQDLGRYFRRCAETILRARTVSIAKDDGGSQVAMQFDMPDATLVKQGCIADERLG